MTQARKRLVAVETTPYYHVVGRCVRRAFLCGEDAATGRSYEHRRQWVVDRIGYLAELFSIDVLAYAVMSNHYHIVVRLRPEDASAWSNDEVIDRWARLYGLPPLLAKLRAGECSEVEHAVAVELLERRRQRLCSLSWFMKCLNEFIARQANKEDHCTGAFWEGRFKSQALLDERALLSCMTYVDLNPIRAAMAKTPEQSDFTSIQARIQLKEPIRLALFRDQVPKNHRDEAIPFYLPDYLELVDWSGRAQRRGKRGKIDESLPPILERFGFDEASWQQSMKLFQQPFPMIGGPDQVRLAAQQLSRSWFRGIGEMAFLANA